MTQTAAAAPDTTDTQTPTEPPKEKRKSRVILARVMIRGEGVIFERKKLWPQGPLQTQAGACAWEVWALQIELDRLAKEKTPPSKLNEKKRELDNAVKDLEAARHAASKGSSVIECTVEDMYLIDGDAEAGRPATIEILGMPFGDWAVKRVAITATIPQANCFWENIWPLAELQEHAAMLAAEVEEGEDEEGDDEDSEDEDGEGDDEGGSVDSEGSP